MKTPPAFRKTFLKAAGKRVAAVCGTLLLLSVAAAEAQSTLLSYSGGTTALSLGGPSSGTGTGQRAFGFTENTAGALLSSVTLNIAFPGGLTSTSFKLGIYTGTTYTSGQTTSPVTTLVEAFTNPTVSFNGANMPYTFTLASAVPLATSTSYYIVAQDNDTSFATIYGGNAGTFSGTAASPIVINSAAQPGALYANADNNGNTNVSELTNASSNTPGFTLTGVVPEPSTVSCLAVLGVVAGFGLRGSRRALARR